MELESGSSTSKHNAGSSPLGIMESQGKRVPRHTYDRLILQFDYDCFYAQVHENKNPALKSQPLGVRQKNILATCNYKARARGVGKLMLASEARKLCPELVIVDGEDLTAFRDTSKTLFNFLRSYSWNGKAERLGFDEVFMDVTDIIDYNMVCLNRADMEHGYFHLSKKDPQYGFPCDLTSIAGCVAGTAPRAPSLDDPIYLRLMLGSHLAQYLRLEIEQQFGYTSTCGISTNKVLSKLAGSKNKPCNQTTLLAYTDEHVVAFIEDHVLRSIPGLGFRTAQILESHVLEQDIDADSHTFESKVLARDIRLHPSVNASFIETCLGGQGFEKGIGLRIWNLLHGVDLTEVKEASDVPSQISIEDTYKGLETVAQITAELHKLSCSLVRRMRVDLLVPDEASSEPGAQRWMATPKTLRLSIRSWPQPDANRSFARISRSAPLPSFIFDLKAECDQVAEQLVSEALIPLLRRLQSEKGPRWNLQLLNICVSNLIVGAAEGRAGAGRDIAAMFKTQDEVLRPWKITEAQDDEQPDTFESEAFGETDSNDESDWDASHSPICTECGRSIPEFALAAHLRFHELGG